MKVLTAYSDTHLKLYKAFMNNFPLDPDVDLILRYTPQVCSGNYEEVGAFTEQVKHKIRYIIEYVKTLAEDELLYFVDIDIIFYRCFHDDLVKLMETTGKDMLIQSDGPCLCSGQFVLKKAPGIVELFESMLEYMNRTGEHDQTAMNRVIGESTIDWGILPERYFCYGAMNGHKRWDGTDNINVPADLISHHLNWTVGVDNKYKLYQTVKSIVTKRHEDNKCQ